MWCDAAAAAAIQHLANMNIYRVQFCWMANGVCCHCLCESVGSLGAMCVFVYGPKYAKCNVMIKFRRSITNNLHSHTHAHVLCSDSVNRIEDVYYYKRDKLVSTRKETEDEWHLNGMQTHKTNDINVHAARMAAHKRHWQQVCDFDSGTHSWTAAEKIEIQSSEKFVQLRLWRTHRGISQRLMRARARTNCTEHCCCSLQHNFTNKLFVCQVCARCY